MVYVSLARPDHQLLADGCRRTGGQGAVRSAARCRSCFGFDDLPLGIQILFSFALVNLFLGIFNLVPIPPLDGSALIERVLPRATGWTGWYRFRPVRLSRAVHPRVHHRLRRPDPRPVRGSTHAASSSGEPASSLGPLRRRAVAGPGARRGRRMGGVGARSGRLRRVATAARPRSATHGSRWPAASSPPRGHALRRRSALDHGGADCTISASSTPAWACTGTSWRRCPERRAVGDGRRVVRAQRVHPSAWVCTSATRSSARFGSASLGGHEEAAAWAAAHHDRASWDGLPLPAPVVAALAAADHD